VSIEELLAVHEQLWSRKYVALLLCPAPTALLGVETPYLGLLVSLGAAGEKTPE